MAEQDRFSPVNPDSETMRKRIPLSKVVPRENIGVVELSAKEIVETGNAVGQDFTSLLTEQEIKNSKNKVI